MRLEIPMLPPRECSPNWRGHWAQKASAVKFYRNEVRICALQNAVWRGVSFKKAVVSCTFIVRDRRGFKDSDNAIACLKPAMDGCVDAGLIPDDGPDYLLLKPPIMYKIDKERAPMTVLEFKAVE